MPLASSVRPRGPGTRLPGAVRADLEAEANAAADGVLAGRPVRVRPRGVCPPEQPAVPLILLLAVVAGLFFWPNDHGSLDIPVDPKAGHPPERATALHNVLGGGGFDPAPGAPALLLTPVEGVDLSDDAAGPPDNFTVPLPGYPGAEPESTPTRAAERIPAAGGANRPAPVGRGSR